ncbi:MAG: hypothetical protein JWN89_22 [Parcubacteria group bacterium]|nr:hypothetical protein [Parcubacteria group bacterium]
MSSLLAAYFSWHYGRGFIEASHFAARIFKATKESFSFSLILRTFASPWKRSGEGYIKNDPSTWVTTFVFNSLMRVLGMVIRTFILVSGAGALFVAAIAVISIFFLWAVAPFLILGSFIVGLKELFL